MSDSREQWHFDFWAKSAVSMDWKPSPDPAWRTGGACAVWTALVFLLTTFCYLGEDSPTLCLSPEVTLFHWLYFIAELIPPTEKKNPKKPKNNQTKLRIMMVLCCSGEISSSPKIQEGASEKGNLGSNPSLLICTALKPKDKTVFFQIYNSLCLKTWQPQNGLSINHSGTIPAAVM